MRFIKIYMFITLCVLSIICNGQNQKETISLSLKNGEASPCLISDLKLGIPYYFMNHKINVRDGYRYRFVVVPKGKSYTFYFEKLSIDEEVYSKEWSSEIDCKTILESLDLNTDLVEISDINWMDMITVSLKLNGKEIKLLLYDRDVLKVSLCDEVDKLFIKLNSAYNSLDLSKLYAFIGKWYKDSEASKDKNIVYDEKTMTIYDIYTAFYNSMKPTKSRRRRRNTSKYILIQNSIKYSILSDDEITNYDDSRKNEYIKISNFRPKLDFGNKKPLYLIDNYRTSLIKFLHKDVASFSYRKSKSRGAFLSDLIPIYPSHDGDSYFLNTHMLVSAIDINNELNKAIVHFSRNYSGGGILFEKNNGVWLMRKTESIWIE